MMNPLQPKRLRSLKRCTHAQMKAHQACFIESAIRAANRQPASNLEAVIKFVQETSALNPTMQFRNEFNQEFTDKMTSDAVASAFFADTLFLFYSNTGEDSDWSDQLCARLVEAFLYAGLDTGVGIPPRTISLASAGNTLMEALAWNRPDTPLRDVFSLFKPKVNIAEVLHIFLRNNRHLIFSAMILLTAEEIIAKLLSQNEIKPLQTPNKEMKP
jgi:hypothetical protein